jgi:hypothetical protein
MKKKEVTQVRSSCWKWSVARLSRWLTPCKDDNSFAKLARPPKPDFQGKYMKISLSDISGITISSRANSSHQILIKWVPGKGLKSA